MDQQRGRLVDAYKVAGHGMQLGASKQMRRSWSDSQVPLLPQIGSAQASPFPGLQHMSRSAVRLPMLPEGQLSAADALALAAAAASESAAKAAKDASLRLAAQQSQQSWGRNKRRGRAHILQLLSLDDDRHRHTTHVGVSSRRHDPDLQRQWDWECRNGSKDSQFSRASSKMEPSASSNSPPKAKDAKDGMQEFQALREITKAAQQLCVELVQKPRIEENSRSPSHSKSLPPDTQRAYSKPQAKKKTLGQLARKKWEAQEKEHADRAAEAEMEAWRRSTLAAVPEADLETRFAAEQRKKQQDDERRQEARDEEEEEERSSATVAELADPTAVQQLPDGKENPSEADVAGAPKSTTDGKEVRKSNPRSAGEDRNDSSYGMPPLADRLDQITKSFFGKGDFLDEVSIGRLKTVFNRFRATGGNEILKDELVDICQYMGYVVPSEGELRRVADVVTSYSELDFTDFMTFVEKYARHQFERYKVLFKEFDIDSSGDIDISELRKLLMNIGFVVVRNMIEESLDVVDMDGNGELNFEEFIRFLTVYMHYEGFTQEQVKDMYSIYEGLVAESTKVNAKSKGLQPDELGEALVAVFGLQSEPIAVRLGKSITSSAGGQTRNADVANGLTFPEFLIYARRLREFEQENYKAEFAKHDADNSGNINAEELADVLRALGYRPMRKVVREVLEEVDFEADAELDFEEFFYFMLIFRQRDGFTKQELEEYKQVFEKHDDDGSGSINVHELGDMLRYLGYSIGADDLHLLVSQVDVNKDGSLDINEFLRLMRLHRESALNRMQEIFTKFSHAKEILPRTKLTSAVEEFLGNEAYFKFAREATKNHHEGVDFEDFVPIADDAHWLKVLSERRMAGFAQAEIAQLEDMFKHYDKDGSRDIDSHEVQSLMEDFGMSCRTRQERDAVIDKMDLAKKLAQEAGMPRDASKSNTMMTFWELVQLVRLIKTQRAKQQEERNRKITQALKFSKQETDDFRAIFINWARHDGAMTRQGGNSLGKQVSLSEKASNRESEANDYMEDENAGLTIPMFQKVLKSLGMSIAGSQKQVLEDKVTQTAELTESGDLSFVGFLQMLRWMMDTNFCGINGAAQKAVTSATEEHFQKETGRR